jgi:hypothetical protein
MLINKRYQDNIKRMAVYSGEDKRSDYNLLIGMLRFKGKRVISKNKKKTYNIFSLRDT